MNDAEAFAAQVIALYLDDPDTPQMPSSADWDIARNLFLSGVPFGVVQLAFKLGHIRRRQRAAADPLPPIRSLAYFRTIARNLTSEERHPAYVAHVDRVFDELRRSSNPRQPRQNRAPQPESGALS